MTPSPQDDDFTTGETESPFDESAPQPPIPLREAIGLYLLCLGLMLSAGLLLQAADLRIGLIVTEGGLILLPTLYFIQKNRLSFREVLHLKPVRFQTILMVILIMKEWTYMTSRITIGSFNLNDIGTKIA